MTNLKAVIFVKIWANNLSMSWCLLQLASSTSAKWSDPSSPGILPERSAEGKWSSSRACSWWSGGPSSDSLTETTRSWWPEDSSMASRFWPPSRKCTWQKFQMLNEGEFQFTKALLMLVTGCSDYYRKVGCCEWLEFFLFFLQRTVPVAGCTCLNMP